MGKGYGSSRRVGLIGAIVVGLMLALAVPSIALAVNTASFKSPVPASTSWINVAKPTISLFGYDRYGVKASGISMWVSGRRVSPTFTYNNLGKKSFRLSYAVPAALPDGAVRVTVKVKDARGKLSSTSWLFNVDTIAPVTVSSGALPTSPGLGAVSMSATDGGSGVKHTYWTLDNGAAMEGAILVTLDLGSHHVDYWSVDIAGNVETPKTLSTTVVGAPAIMHKSATGALSSACTTCHRDNLATVHEHAEFGGCGCHTASFLTARMAVFMAPGATPAECVSCHTGAHAAHMFTNGVSGDEGWVAASGHNTPTYGTVGAFTKWDGSEGVVIKDSVGATITQEWPLPTASVFWSQSKALNMDGSVNASGIYSLNPTDAPAVAMANRGGTAMASKIDTTVGWNSVVLCTDCHTNLNGSMGPQGANAGQVGLDPNFPDDWTKAELTSFDPTGMRSIESTRGSGNAYYTQLGGNVYMPAEVINGTLASAPSIETTVQKKYGAGMPDQTTTVTVKPGGFYGETNQTGTGYLSAVKTGRFICQKCHKLTNSFQGLAIEGNGRGFRDNNYNYMGMSNEAHMEHHNDLATGQANCVSCHIAIPHGWKRPRLLVYESDPAPYKVQYIWPNYRSTDVAVLSTNNPDLSQGNWGWLNKAPNGNALTTNNRYQDVTLTNVWTNAINSTHIDKVSASPTAFKELEIGVPPLEYAGYDAFNGTKWGLWNHSLQGVIWPGDEGAGAARIDLSVWDVAQGKFVNEVDGEAPIQNNCNGCTSASASTHAPQSSVATSTVSHSNEGVNPALPYWK